MIIVIKFATLRNQAFVLLSIYGKRVYGLIIHKQFLLLGQYQVGIVPYLNEGDVFTNPFFKQVI